MPDQAFRAGSWGAFSESVPRRLPEQRLLVAAIVYNASGTRRWLQCVPVVSVGQQVDHQEPAQNAEERATARVETAGSGWP